MPSLSGGLFQRNSSTDAYISLRCFFRVCSFLGSLFGTGNVMSSQSFTSIPTNSPSKLTKLLPPYAYFVRNGKRLSVGPLLSETRFVRSSLTKDNCKAPQDLASLPFIFSRILIYRSFS